MYDSKYIFEMNRGPAQIVKTNITDYSYQDAGVVYRKRLTEQRPTAVGDLVEHELQETQVRGRSD